MSVSNRVVSETAPFELARDLALKAQAAGFAVSVGQIARWNRAGLLPKPHQHGLGQGQGSEIRYPIGTGDQLIALCSFHREFRKLEIVGWYLWLNGFSVAEKYWHKPLIAAATLFDNGRRVFKTKVLDASYGIVSVRRTGEQILSSLADRPSKIGQFRRTRRRVGTGQIGDFCRLAFTIAIGAYRASREFNDNDRRAERELLETGFGLQRAYIDRLGNGDPLLNSDMEPVLEDLSGRLARIKKTAMLRAIESGQIEAARDDMRLLFFGLNAAYDQLQKSHGRGAFGLGVAADFARISDIKLEALLILLFQLTVRSDPQNRLREILDIIRRGIDGRQFGSSAPA